MQYCILEQFIHLLSLDFNIVIKNGSLKFVMFYLKVTLLHSQMLSLTIKIHILLLSFSVIMLRKSLLNSF